MGDRDDTIAGSAGRPDDMSKALSMAAEIFSSAQGDVPSSQPSQPPDSVSDTPTMSNEELASALLNMLENSSADQENRQETVDTPSAQSGDESAKPGGLGSLAALLPPIMQAMSGGGNFIKPEKLNLIKALKPYMSEARGGSIDRAIRMANIAQAAKSALTALGR